MIVPEEFNFDRMVEEHYQNNENKNMQTDLKGHLISAATTFVSTFLVTISLAIANTNFTFTKEALLALAVSALVAGVRGVAKLIIE